MAQKKLKSKQKKQLKVPKTVQDSIPYEHVYANGTFELEPNMYSRTCKLSDTNFFVASEVEQENILNTFAEVLNILPYKTVMQITCFNRSVEKESIEQLVKVKAKADGLNKYREEYNEMLSEKLKEGNNNIIKEKYLTLTISALSEAEADKEFNRLELEFNSILKRVNPKGIQSLTLNERLACLYDIYNPTSEVRFGKKKLIDGQIIDTTNLEWVNSQGLTSKDVIGCSGMKFKSNYFKLGDTYGCALYIQNQGNTIIPDLNRELTSIPCNMLVSTFFETERDDLAIKMLRMNLTNINSNVSEAQKNATKAGYSVDLISSELMDAQAQAKKVLEDVTISNQKIIYTTTCITIFANSKEELDDNFEKVKTAGTKYMCTIKRMDFMQEAGLNSSLPLGYKKFKFDRLQTTSSATAFHPYSTIEMLNPRGVYMGQNKVSGNIVKHDRFAGKNYNEAIIGESGSGKSFSAKGEMNGVLLEYIHDSVYIIDPDNEYKPYGLLFGAQVVHIANGSNTFINPLDMDINYGADDDGSGDPVAAKVEFLESLCETMAGGIMGLSPMERSIINRCGRNIYRPYLEYMETVKDQGITIDYEAMPTLVDFHEDLMNQPEEIAKDLALRIEQYCTGTKDIFSHHTNVDINSRFVIFDIKELGPQMKELGMQVCLNYVWNKVINNFNVAKQLREGKISRDVLLNKFMDPSSRTWVYIDEFHCLTTSDSTVAFLMNLWKRARKWTCALTAISQNVEDFLRTMETRNILNNCSTLHVMNLQPMDRAHLSEIYNISPSQLAHITDTGPGKSLLYTGEKSVIQIENSYPSNTSIYKAMTTKASDLIENYDVSNQTMVL